MSKCDFTTVLCITSPTRSKATKVVGANRKIGCTEQNISFLKS